MGNEFTYFWGVQADVNLNQGLGIEDLGLRGVLLSGVLVSFDC